MPPVMGISQGAGMMVAQIQKIERPVNSDIVDALEEILEWAKAGHVSDIAIVGHHAEDGDFFRHAVYADRWRILGALEYAKDAVHRG